MCLITSDKKGAGRKDTKKGTGEDATPYPWSGAFAMKNGRQKNRDGANSAVRGLGVPTCKIVGERPTQAASHHEGVETSLSPITTPG